MSKKKKKRKLKEAVLDNIYVLVLFGSQKWIRFVYRYSIDYQYCK